MEKRSLGDVSEFALGAVLDFASGHFDSLKLPTDSFECHAGSTICR